MLYYHAIFESSILNDIEKNKLLKLLKDNNKNEIVDHSWNLSFDSKKDGFLRSRFVEKVHGKPNVTLLIRLKGECIIGGYTKNGWDKTINHYAYRPDKDAFVYYLKSNTNKDINDDPFVSNVQQTEEKINHALGYDYNCYGCFGETWLWYFKNGGQFKAQTNSGITYQQFPIGHGIWITGI